MTVVVRPVLGIAKEMEQHVVGEILQIARVLHGLVILFHIEILT